MLITRMVTSSLILKIVDLDNDFVVCMDACNIGLGGVLMQEGYVISYIS